MTPSHARRPPVFPPLLLFTQRNNRAVDGNGSIAAVSAACRLPFSSNRVGRGTGNCREQLYPKRCFCEERDTVIILLLWTGSRAINDAVLLLETANDDKSTKKKCYRVHCLDNHKKGHGRRFEHCFPIAQVPLQRIHMQSVYYGPLRDA